MRKRSLSLTSAALVLLGAGLATPARAERTLDDYKYFRALSVDLLGRAPSRDEVAEFERPDFKVDSWLDAHLQGPDYAERLTRVYANLLHVQFKNLTYTDNAVGLGRVEILDPSGKKIWVYYRSGQKRSRDAKNGGFCLTEAESGLKVANPPSGTAIPVTDSILNLYTTKVKPWWLYADYRSKTPADRYDPATWAKRFPGYTLRPELLKENDGKADTVEVRVCSEEAQTADNANLDGKTQMISCLSGYGALSSSGCGCGAGLERCMPTPSLLPQFPTAMVNSSENVLLGMDAPFDQYGLSYRGWQGLWMYQELYTFVNRLFLDNRDFREVVTGRYTYVNGPLAQFYRFAARSNWRDYSFNYFEPTPLVDSGAMPPDLLPMDTGTWRKVEDRGPNAAGVLTMPVFLWKNATRRARAHSVYNVFLCKDFVAPPGLQLSVANEPDLMKRDGCAACHQTLEPLAAYFSRIVETDWSWLDPKFYPAQNPACKKGAGGVCTSRYDTSFVTDTNGMLRGAYASIDHTDAGPAGLGKDLAARPDFATCVAKNVATSFLGRDLRTEDGALTQQMVDALSGSGFRIQPMVKVLLRSDAYRNSNNLASGAWRNGGAK